jgi:hypothetical protein
MVMAWFPADPIPGFQTPDPWYSHLCWSMCLMLLLSIAILLANRRNPA